MSSRFFVIAETNDAEEVLEKMRYIFGLNISNKYHYLLDEDRLYLSDGDFSDKEKWKRLSEYVDRFIEVRADKIKYEDEGDRKLHNIVYADLYSVNEDKIKKIDSSLSCSWSRESSPYQQYTFLPAYFYQKHQFKMFSLAKTEGYDIEYDETYQPTNNKQKNYECPCCGSGKITVKSWDAICDKCGLEHLEPWFKHPDKFWIAVKNNKTTENLVRKQDNSGNDSTEFNEEGVDDSNSKLDYVYKILWYFIVGILIALITY